MRANTYPILIFVALFSMFACDSGTKSVDSCGDGFVDPGEDCDGSALNEASCASLGHYNMVGQLACKPDCTFDTTACGGRCGDGTIDAEEGEACDGTNLNANSCQSFNYTGGTLACDPENCSFDFSACVSACGNRVLEPGETCDDGDTDTGDGCDASCGIENGFTCDTEVAPSVCTPVCGDGLIRGSEQCDGGNTNGETCLSQGYHGGQLVCDPEACTFILDDCIATEIGRASCRERV